MRLLKTDTLQEAREKLLQQALKNPPGIERIPFEESLGRILAESLESEMNIPDFRKSTVDGYAVNSKDTQGVTDSIPVFLDVIEQIAMGKEPEQQLHAGQAAYVPTGGMLPEGADAVVMVEYAECFDENSIAVYESVSPGRNVIQPGDDIKKSQVFMERGTLIRPQEIGVMASAGISTVSVYRPWKISVISTGDELVGVNEVPAKGKTRDINTYSISAAGRRYGFEVIHTAVLKDDRRTIKKTVAEALDASDVVLVSGGSSQGEKDYTADIMDELSSPGVLTHGIALKPGKPTILAYDAGTQTVLAGLPGHPVAALIVFELIIGWLYRKLTGMQEPCSIPARITENISAAGGKLTCQMVKLTQDAAAAHGSGSDEAESGIRYAASPIFGKSGLMTVLSEADGYILIDTDDEGVKRNQIVQVNLF